MSSMIPRLKGKIAQLARRAWMKYAVGISRTLYRDDRRRLKRAYALQDPWHMDSPLEQYRFEKINGFIGRKLGRVGSILEIGSGEGHHTEKLLERCARVDGLEISPLAASRARKRCPKAFFFEAAFPELPVGLTPPYDLVIASEALYYIKDVPAALAAMDRLGRHCLVTFYQDQWERLSPYFKDFPEMASESFSFGPASWKIFFWKPKNGPIHP